MGKKEQILTLLSQKDLTTKETASELDMSENEARVYINRLKKEERVKEIGKKERYKLYRAIDKSKDLEKENNILKQAILEFNKLMSYNKGNLKFPNDLDKNIIREAVKKCR